jgi:hypothetical protein
MTKRRRHNTRDFFVAIQRATATSVELATLGFSSADVAAGLFVAACEEYRKCGRGCADSLMSCYPPKVQGNALAPRI